MNGDNETVPQEVDALKGMADNIFDEMGVPRPFEFIPSPKRAMEVLGIPTLHQALPTPKEFMDSLIQNRGAMIRPPMLPSPRDVLGAPEQGTNGY